MTRVKKEFQKRGLRLAIDYDMLPCGELDDVRVDVETATVYEYYYCIGWVSHELTRSGEINITYMDC